MKSGFQVLALETRLSRVTGHYDQHMLPMQGPKTADWLEFLSYYLSLMSRWDGALETEMVEILVDGFIRLIILT